MLYAIIVCALAAVAGLFAAIVLATYSISTRRQVQAISLDLASLSQQLQACASSLQTTGHAALAAAVADLAADLAEQKATWATQRSKLWGRLGSMERDGRDPDTIDHINGKSDRDHLRATLLPHTIGVVPKPRS